MNKAVFALALVVAMLVLAALTMFAPSKAHAQGFQDEPTCYSWNGGYKSAGSFSKCPQPWVVAKAPAAPPPPVVVTPPVMQNVVCPPQVILQPEPKKVRKHITHKPLPKCTP
jgi:hypothetical protein